MPDAAPARVNHPFGVAMITLGGERLSDSAV
jgi:hypothetical protein